MLRLLATRLAAIIPTLLFATFTIFGLQHIGPADPATVILGENATEERIAEVREQLGLNDPLIVQYGKWLGDVASGDLGESIIGSERVGTLIGRSLPITLQLVLAGVFISVVVGIPLGILAATRANKPTDVAVTSASAVGVSIPNFWLGLVLITLFAITWKVFPARGFATIGDGLYEAFRFTALPAFVVSTSGIAIVTRQVRGAMIEALSADSVRTHEAKGPVPAGDPLETRPPQLGGHDHHGDRSAGQHHPRSDGGGRGGLRHPGHGVPSDQRRQRT